MNIYHSRRQGRGLENNNLGPCESSYLKNSSEFLSLFVVAMIEISSSISLDSDFPEFDGTGEVRSDFTVPESCCRINN